MSAPPAVRAYRALLRLYPRRFREEHGPDMVRLFADQLRDEPALRVWARSLVDLAVTVPNRHLEAHMNRPPSSTVALLFTVVALTGMGFAIVGGSSRGMLAVGLSVAAASAALAAVAWRHSRPLTVTRSATAHWWKFLTAGAGILAGVIVITTVTGEVDDSVWWPMLFTVVCAVVLVATGLVLGVGQRTGNHPGKAPS